MSDKIRVMIVDDEYIVREDLKTLIDWEEQGFQIVCEANNGEQGIQYFKKYRPELIIADIKMPVKDGLQMAREILDGGTSPEFILLTAYDEFDFARKAMKMHIAHYLLKHEMEDRVLLGLLGEIREKIYRCREEQRQQVGMNLRELLVGHRTALELDTRGQFCAFLLVKMRTGATVLDTLIASLERSRYLELVHVMESGENAVYFLKYNRVSELLYRSETTDFARRLSVGLGTTVALSARFQESDTIRDIYENACRSFEIAVFCEEGRGVLLPEAQVDSEISHGSVSAVVYLLKECLRQKNYREFLEVLENYILEQCVEKRRGAQFLYAKSFFIGVLEEYNESRCLLDKRAFDSLRCDDNVFAFRDKIRRIVEKLEGGEGDGLSKNMRKVVRFIEEHYGENLALEDIAAVLGMNAMYAGQLFKKEVGVSFKQYLCDLRMGRAKELLGTGRYKIYEVGELVGYQSTQYFSSIFKKETGISPGEFLQEGGDPREI